jgi:spore coat protein A, manganese oxidase
MSTSARDRRGVRAHRRAFLVAVTASAVVTTSLVVAPGSSGAAAQAPPPGGTLQWAMFEEELPVPPTIPAAGAVLCAVSGTHRYADAAPQTPTLGYVPAGSDGACPTGGPAYLGPTLEAQRDVPATLVVKHAITSNPLASQVDMRLHGTHDAQGRRYDVQRPPIAVHKHGGHVAPADDGGPEDVFGPGTGARGSDVMERTFHYANDQEATTLWYHDHAMGITRLNVVNGLAGFYLLRDASDTGKADNPLGLPTGLREVPLVLQDRSLDSEGRLRYDDGPWVATPDPLTGQKGPWLPEFFGDLATVNGKAFPKHTVDRAVYRYRVLNGSNARVYRLQLKGPGADMYQIGTDGGLLNAPVPLKQLLIAPGERADVLLDFRGARAGTAITVTNDAPVPFPNGPRKARKGGVPVPEIMQFQVKGATTSAGTIPARLRGPGLSPAIEPAGAYAAEVAATGGQARRIFLNEILDPATGAPVAALLNNLPFSSPDARLEQPRNGTVETWTFVNTTGDAHPMHMHLAQFQVLTRQRLDAARYLAAVNATLALPPGCPGLPDPCAAHLGPWGPAVPDPGGFARGRSAVPATERGWKDTVVVNPGEAVTVVVAFGGAELAQRIGLPLPYTTAYAGRYVLHCHILEHEDNEMMLPYLVRPEAAQQR